ncbi:MAG: uroporphyrinogen decarboxylase family protein [bacterium]
MDSKTRLISAIKGQEIDHIPLYCWMFGFKPPKYLRWKESGKEITYWYTMRLEHIHTLPQPWNIGHDFNRVKKLLSIGIDDVLDVSVPWSVHPDVKIKDWKELPTNNEACSILFREYNTPAGILRHIVRKTNENTPPGWVIQPDHVPIFEDYNIPRAIRHAFSEYDDIEKLRYLLCKPTKDQLNSFTERMKLIKDFKEKHGVMSQGWTAFGMDGIIWLTGVERAISLAIEEPEIFQSLLELIYDFDRMRTDIMLSIGGVDMIVQRGWYSSTDFWSPALFRKFVLPYLKKLVYMVHQAGLLFAYVMTTGAMFMLDILKESGIDLLYFIDPVQDKININEFKQKVNGTFAVAGGVNSGVILAKGDVKEIKDAVHSAIKALGPDRFILSPVDALFPDTPEQSFEVMMQAWRETI